MNSKVLIYPTQVLAHYELVIENTQTKIYLLIMNIVTVSLSEGK